MTWKTNRFVAFYFISFFLTVNFIAFTFSLQKLSKISCAAVDEQVSSQSANFISSLHPSNFFLIFNN